MSIGDVAADFGKGLFAGLAGTAEMTVSSTLEMKLSGRTWTGANPACLEEAGSRPRRSAAGDLVTVRTTPAFRARIT
jgi:hypothetical protein